MDKRELLLSIGFSKEYISHLDRLDQSDAYVSEIVSDAYQFQAHDVSNVIVNEPKTSFRTKVIVRQK
jgi:hypothetical protein